MAGCLPHEQVASLAQTQPVPSERLQQVAGIAAVGSDIVDVEVRFLVVMLMSVEGSVV